MKKDYIVILVTTKNKPQAKAIARELLNAKLIACANIFDQVDSLFWWEGKIDQSTEALLVLKTTASHFKKVETVVKKMHSYTTPEIIALPVIKGSQDYLKWISTSVC